MKVASLWPLFHRTFPSDETPSCEARMHSTKATTHLLRGRTHAIDGRIHRIKEVIWFVAGPHRLGAARLNFSRNKGARLMRRSLMTNTTSAARPLAPDPFDRFGTSLCTTAPTHGTRHHALSGATASRTENGIPNFHPSHPAARPRRFEVFLHRFLCFLGFHGGIRLQSQDHRVANPSAE